MVDDSLLPHIEKIQSARHVINLQREEIDKQNTIIQTLQDKLDKVEERVPLSFFLLLKTIARCL
jgi:GTPase involved in cell partitioning and DNA repair